MFGVRLDIKTFRPHSSQYLFDDSGQNKRPAFKNKGGTQYDMTLDHTNTIRYNPFPLYLLSHLFFKTLGSI